MLGRQARLASGQGALSDKSSGYRPRVATEPPFARLDASSWELVGGEPDGLSEHPWLERLGDERLWLYKPVEVKAGNRQGEDWAEKVVGEIGLLLGVPCAEIELATRHGREGSISRDVRPSGWELQPGAALLDGHIEGYESRTKLRDGHSLDNIQAVLADVSQPPTATCPDQLSGYDVFCGYLMLDALVANRDRHDHNWAILIPPGESAMPAALSPSFDHASSLGFNLLDERRARLLAESSVLKWALGGTAWRFEHAPAPAKIESLVDLAVRAFARSTEEAQAYWRASLDGFDEAEVRSILDRTPGMSDLARTFAIELVLINRQRLLSRLRERRSTQ